MSFLDPQTTESGEPYGPVRYKELVEERYYIAKRGYISYESTGKMTPTEREHIKQLIIEEAQRTKERFDELKQRHKK